MANESQETLQLVLGAMMAQYAVCEFLVKNGVIENGALVEHLAAKRVIWEKSSTELGLFPVDVLASMLAGRPTPVPPGRLN